MSDWKEPHPTWIVGHRGAPRRARENTIESFDFAESFGVDAIEFDVRLTREGEAVVFHDEDVVLGTQRIPVRTFTAREIEKLVIPSGMGEYRIPRLEQVFHRYGPGLRYIVEVKSSPGMALGTMARRIAKLAGVYGVEARCLVASFDAEFLKRMRETAPGLATSYLFAHPVALPAPGQSAPLFPPVDGIGPRKDLVTPTLLSQAAMINLSVHPWTVDEPEEIRRLLAAGVASITTNAPDVAREIREGTDSRETGLAYPAPGA
ncbi:MAG TPA: glycerophosphodiester phosphodiesterase [Thermoanaerobaculia bacterium]|nr:glycerophosphodiester phosphodiesterase [Thermoanaerobaculia bacterium]